MEDDKDNGYALNFISIFNKRTSSQNSGGMEDGMSWFSNTFQVPFPTVALVLPREAKIAKAVLFLKAVQCLIG